MCLPAATCGQRLRLVQTVRRGEHHRVNVGTADDLLVAVDERELVLAAEILGAAARACARQTKPMSSLLPATEATSERPQRPSPTMAARIMV